MAETKKRPHADDAEQSLPRKRAVSEEKLSASLVNGVAPHPDEPKDSDHLEMFRKDAIYRRMKYYSREHERSEARVAELERRRSSCEAGLAALEACWTQIIGTIRLLIKPDDLPHVDVQAEELYDLTARVSDHADPQYVESLRGKMQATSDLVSAFVRLGGQTQVKIVQDEDYRMRQKAQTEESSLRAELSLTRTRLRDITAERDNYREQLTVVEKRLDRMQSEAVLIPRGPPPNGSIKIEPSSEASASPAPPPVEDDVRGQGTPQEWEAIAKQRSFALHKARSEYAEMRARFTQLINEMRVGTEEAVINSATYRSLKEQMDSVETAHSQAQEKIAVLQEEILQLEEDRNHLAVTVASDPIIVELKAMIAKRDSENLRLREQRDQHAAELLERKQKEQVKWQAVAEYKQLSESRSERIELLQSEVMRLKSRLAAHSGDEDLMQFILRGFPGESKDYIDDLKGRVRAAEGKVAALEATLSEHQSDRMESLKADVNIRQRLAEAEGELEKYRSAYGDVSALPADARLLLERLQRKERENEYLALQLKQQQETESSIYAELDRLSAAWESLDKQLQSKVFDLSAMEEKLAKNLTDKAKSDNKYIAAMRSKEASDLERKQLSRECEKQAKINDIRVETEARLQAQLSATEKEVNKLRHSIALLEHIERKRKPEIDAFTIRVQAQKLACEKVSTALKEELEAVSRQQAELMSAREAASKAKKEAERQAAKFKALSENQSTSSGTREAQLQREVDQCMSILKCSTCKMNMRNTVITKCMHSFCKSCVEARIATRQRKCPACNLAFSQGEVQTLFFQ